MEQGLAADEMLLHFSSLAMHMNGDIVLRKVRYAIYYTHGCAIQKLCDRMQCLMNLITGSCMFEVYVLVVKYHYTT